MKLIRNIVPNAKVINEFLIYLHIVRIREIRNVKIINKRRKCLSC